MKCHLQCYGSATVGEKGQVVLPAEARRLFKIEPGDKLIVFGAENSGFERIVLMKAEAVTKMYAHLMDMEQLVKDPKKLKAQGEKGLKTIKAALDKSKVRKLVKAGKKKNQVG